MAFPIPEKRIAEFEKLGLGLFIHWGLYSQYNRGEWVYHIENMEMSEYKNLINTFTAEDFDSDKLARVAKENGFKYIVISARHHEGFSLYDTNGLCEFDSVHSPAKRDLLMEFTKSCRKYDIKPFFYHTTLDWYNEDFDDNFERYLEYLRKSVEILCRNYGKIGGFWFDGNWSKPDADWHEDELYATIRKYQPDAMIINNTGLNARGECGNPEIDSVTFEQGVPHEINRDGSKKYVASEMCVTTNDHWGIAEMDLNYKSPKEIIEDLCNCRKVGSNFLLNIGLTAQGGIEEMQMALLNIVGRWMSVFGESIYDVKPCSVVSKNNNFVLKGEQCLYLFALGIGIIGNTCVTVDVMQAGVTEFENVHSKIKSVKWLDNNEPLDFTQKDDILFVNFSGYRYGSNYCVRVAKAEIE